LPWIFRFHRRVYLIEREFAGILRLRTRLLRQVMLPFRLRMATRVSLIESQTILILRSSKSFVSAESMPVLEILVAVFKNLPRFILLFKVRVIIGIETNLIKIPAKIRVVIGRSHRFHIYLEQNEAKPKLPKYKGHEIFIYSSFYCNFNVVFLKLRRIFRSK